MVANLFTHENKSFEIELPEDSSTWAGETNRILFETYPQLAQFPSKLIIDKFEPQKLYAKGSFVFDINGVIINIPIIIRNKKLQPFDTMLINGEWYALNPDIISEIIANAISFGEAVNTEDVINFNEEPINNDVPQYSYSTNRNRRLVTASLITHDKAKELAKRIVTDKLLIKHATSAFKSITARVLQMKTKEPVFKLATIYRDYLGSCKMTILTKENELLESNMTLADARDFIKKHAATKYTNFIKRGFIKIIPEQSEQNFIKSLSLNTLQNLLDALAKPISGPGIFSMFNNFLERKPIMVVKIKRINKSMPQKYKEHMNMGDLLGIDSDGCTYNLTKEDKVLPAEIGLRDFLRKIDSPSISELKIDDKVLINNNGEFLEPIRISSTSETEMGKVITGKTEALGEPFIGVILNKYDHTKTASQKMFPEKNFTILSPKSKFYKVKTSHTEIMTADKAKITKIAAAYSDRAIKLMHRNYDNSFVIKTADKAIICNNGDVQPKLCAFGVSLKDSEQYIKEARDNSISEIILFSNKEKIATKSLEKIHKIDWVKIASLMQSDESVDSALGLQYLTEDNINKLYENLPVYKKTLSNLAELLVSVRLGNNIASEQTIKAAMDALSNLIQELTLYSKY